MRPSQGREEGSIPLSRSMKNHELALHSIISQTIFDQAEEIVNAHKPTDPRLEGFEPLLMAGINPEETLELNSAVPFLEDPEKTRARFAELRIKYAEDPLALEQIDYYDPESEYRKRYRLLSDAVLKGDTKAEAESLAWIKEHYPLLYAKQTGKEFEDRFEAGFQKYLEDNGLL
jgi:hypothetical protein